MTGPPVIGQAVLSTVVLLGQAPGTKEIEGGRPFAWTAGKNLFGWFERIGLDEQAFRSRVYMAAVCRCFPGKSKSGGDRVPSRQEIANWISERARKGESFDPEDNDRLRRAIEKKLWEDKKHNINFSAMVSDKTTDPDHKGKKTNWVERLKEEFGYCEVCAENVIDHAGAEVAREELGSSA